jgi:RHS repeat-associated protein
VASRYKSTDHEKDSETGYDDRGARWWDDERLTPIQPDPHADKYPMWSPYMAFANNPIRYVDLDGREPTPAEAARMAAHVYGDKKNGILTGGWAVSSRDFGLTKTDLNNTSTGLKSQVYQRMKADGNLEYTYATAGTEASWKDVGADVKQPLGLSKQYAKSVDNAKTISDKLSETNSELTFTGHSLGGGEAALNALLTDRKAVTFNAAGVSDITKFAEGTWKTPFKSESKINAYIMATDPLNLLQNSSPAMPDVNGKRHYLAPTDGSSIYNGHSMDNVLKNFGVKKPEEFKQ